MPDRFDELVVSRTIRAPRAAVWAAFTTEAGLATWWWSGWPDTTYDVDLRLGGRYRIEAPSVGIAVSGSYLVIEAPRRLQMSWCWEDDGEPGPSERVEIVFEEIGASTALRVRHEGPWTSPGPSANYELGWNDVLDVLESTT